LLAKFIKLVNILTVKRKDSQNNNLCLKNMFSIKSTINSLFKGIKKGYQIPTLPDHIIEFTNKPLIRIMRFLGNVSFLTILSKSHLNYHISILFIAMFFATIFTFYHFYLSYHRFKHIRFLLKSGAYEVRNSPLDTLD
jgi:hypothetical protein